jgi:hypothetical protein
VQYEVDSPQCLEKPIWQTIEEFRTVGVRDHPDARRQLLDPGRLQPGRVRAFGVGALVKRMDRRR